jgi:hypothetical protein
LKLGFLDYGTTPEMMIGNIGVVTNYFETKLIMVLAFYQLSQELIIRTIPV